MPAVLFLDQVFVRETFALTKPPGLAGLGMDVLGERLCQSIGQGLGQDRVVLVMIGIELLDQLIAAMARRDGKRPDVILAARLLRRDVIGQRAEILLPWTLPLLTQHREGQRKGSDDEAEPEASVPGAAAAGASMIR